MSSRPIPPSRTRLALALALALPVAGVHAASNSDASRQPSAADAPTQAAPTQAAPLPPAAERALADARAQRDAGHWLAALDGYARVLDAAPAHPGAWRERALTLADLGSAELAWRQAEARPALFSANERLGFAVRRAGRLVTWASLAPADRRDPRAAAREALATVDALLPAAEAEDAGAAQRLGVDRMVALELLGRHAEAVEAFHAREAAGLALPAWAATPVADALLAMQQPEHAVRVLEAGLREDRWDPKARLLLVYAYVEAERFDDARAWLAVLAAEEPAWTRREGARVDSPNWAHVDVAFTAALVTGFADDLPGAEAQLRALVDQAPANAGLQEALSGIERRRGWPTRALDRARTAGALSPWAADPRIAEIESLLDLDRDAEARVALDALLALHPDEPQVRRTARRVARRQGPQWQAWAGYGEARARRAGDALAGPGGNAELRRGLRWEGPLQDDHWRLGALAEQSWITFAGARIPHERVGATFGWRQDALAWGLEAARPLDDRYAGRSLGGLELGGWARWRLHDTVAVALTAWANDPEGSMQARASGLAADSLALALEYSPNERRRLDAGLKRSRYDDGNVRDELFAAGRQRLATGEHHLLDGVAGLSLGRGSAASPDYYSPTRSASLDLGLEAGHLAWRRYDHALRQELALGAGLGWQEGFGTHWTPSLRYGHAWDLGEGRSLSWSIGVSRPVYDGVREQRWGLDFRYGAGE